MTEKNEISKVILFEHAKNSVKEFFKKRIEEIENKANCIKESSVGMVNYINEMKKIDNKEKYNYEQMLKTIKRNEEEMDKTIMFYKHILNYIENYGDKNLTKGNSVFAPIEGGTA